MSRLKIPLMGVILVIVSVVPALAQFPPDPCGSIAQSPSDSAVVVSCNSEPDQQVLVPIWLGILDSVALGGDTVALGVASFLLYVEFDSTVLHPELKEVDTLRDTLGNIIGIQNFYHYDVTDALDTTGSAPGEGLSIQVVDEQDFAPQDNARHRLKILGLPKGLSFYEAIQHGTADTIMYLRMMTDTDAVDGTNSLLNFYDETIWTIDTSEGIPDTLRYDCQYSRYTDPTGMFDIRLKVKPGIHTVGADPLPVIVDFSADPSSISTPGANVELSWIVQNATSVSINQGVGSALPLEGSTTVNPLVSTTYTLTATNSQGSRQRSVTVTVGDIQNENPVVTLIPDISLDSIAQGETVSYTIQATDADNDEITLSPSALPANATFGPTNPVVGVGSVSGNFSFTPNTSQSGSFAFVFTATDDRGGSASKVLTIVVLEPEFDRLYTISAEGQSPVGGLRGTQGIYVPINFVTAQEVYGVQFDFRYDDDYFEVDSIVTTDRTPDFVVYDNIGQTPGRVRVITFGMANETVQPGTSSEVLYVVVSIDSTTQPADYPIYIENGWESVSPDPEFPSLPLLTDSGIIQVDYPGDVNLDRRVDVADVVNVVGYIIGAYTFSNRQFATADVTVNLTVDVFDLVGIINLIYGIPLSPSAGEPIGGPLATVVLDYQDLSNGASDIMVVRSELPTDIAAAQLEILYDPTAVTLGAPTLAEDANHLAMRYKDDYLGRMKVLLHFGSPFSQDGLIRAGVADMISIPITARTDIVSGDKSQIDLERALLSTSDAGMVAVEGLAARLPMTFRLFQNYPNPFNPTTTIRFVLNGSEPEHVNLNVYNILGQEVTTLRDEVMPPGTYDVVWDGTGRTGHKVASGIYLYRLRIGDAAQSKKMLFLK